MKSKAAKINGSTVQTWLIVIIMFVVFLQVLVAVFPTLEAAGGNLSSTNFPLASLFGYGGALWYILAAAVIYLLIRSFGNRK